MINFDAVEFSERRSEEVISSVLLTLSIYFVESLSEAVHYKSLQKQQIFYLQLSSVLNWY